MDKSLRLQLMFTALDKMSGPIKQLQARTRQLSKDFLDNANQLKKLEQAQKNIDGFRKLRQETVASYQALRQKRAEVARIAAEMAKAERPTAALKREFNAASKAADRMASDIAKQRGKLGQLRTGLSEAGVSTRRLADDEQQLARRIEQTNKAIAAQKDKLDRLAASSARGERLKSRGAGIGLAGAGMTAGVTAPIALLGKSAIQAASDAQELQSAFDVTFKGNTDAMNEWAVKTGDALGRSTQELQAASAAFGMFFNQAAPTRAAAANMSKEFAVLAQDLSSFYNVDPGEAAASLQSGLAGEAEPMRRFGVYLDEASMKAQAMKMGIKGASSAWSEQQKVLIRHGLIMASTTDAQGDVVKTADSAANQVRKSSAAWEELKVKAGDKLLPVFTKLVTKLGELVDWVSTLPSGVQTAIMVFAIFLAVIGPILMVIGPLVMGFGMLTTGAAALGIALGPLLLIILAIGVVIAALVAIWYNWDTITANFNATVADFSAAWEQIKTRAMEFWEQLKAGFAQAVTIISTIVTAITNPFTTVMNLLRAYVPQFLAFGANIVNGLINGITGRISALKKAITGGLGKIGDWFSEKLGIKSPSRVFMALGGHVTDGLAIGIQRGTSAPLSRMTALAGGLVGAAALTVAAPGLAFGGAAAGGGGGSGGGVPSSGFTINAPITINAAPGQSAESIGVEVARQLEAREREAAARWRSGFRDD